MRDRLEDFVRNNREEFDFLEPKQELWLGVKTENKSKHRKLNPGRQFLKYAAIVALTLAVSISVQQFIFQKSNAIAENEIEQFPEIPELIEAEIYYTSQLNNKLYEFKKFASDFPQVKESVNIELSELDKAFEELKNDLQDNVSNAEVVDAMIQNYRLKLQILEDILTRLNKKTNDNGNTGIEI